ncbi:ABC transporter ATP-binding protein [Variovorax sp. J31P207]|uniref:ABC transporter ATP-binding protein n=1 Tax=Variovorax sp. J31P207 TaxID=3053510 RepID=UPI0025749B4D|nr:ABC transporter ATP-binding protein [Variovorax sp. J31P207]MDM0071429.1 ABC transporter ATP-binding protein [Variovorax sp. J31P207]
MNQLHTSTSNDVPALLELRGVDAFYENTQALYGVDLWVREGTVTALLGANGAGKTTTLRAVCGSIRRRGSLRFDNAPIHDVATEDLARSGIAHVADGRGTFLQLSVDENLRLGAYSRRDKRATAQDIEVAYQRFPRLKERRHQQAGTLSGGEQQMLAISRALMMRPRLLLLDEPSFGVAPRVVSEIFEVLQSVRNEQRVSMLLVEQDASLALQFADFAFLLESGRVILSGTAAMLSNNELIQRSYLGC